MLLFGKSFSDNQKNKGFTLVELLIVIAIIGVLAAVIVLVINPLEILRKSRDSARLSDLDELQNAINIVLYDPQFGGKALCVGSGSCSGYSFESTRATDGTGWLPINFNAQTNLKMSKLPIDPRNNEDYFYHYSSDELNYELNTVLEAESNLKKMVGDSGDNENLYEIGTTLTLVH